MLPNKNSFLSLPEILWIQIFKYLFITDFHTLLAVCRKLQQYAANYPQIYERECIRLFSSALTLFEYFLIL